MPGYSLAICHDYLTQFGGAERVVVAMHSVYPEAAVYTTMFAPDRTWPELGNCDVRTSFMQHVPFAAKYHRLFLPLYPAAIDSLKLDPVDVVLSSSSAFAKGVRKPAGAVHVCYCHNPMRFAWMSDEYLASERMPRFVKSFLVRRMERLRSWDLKTNDGVDLFVANSQNVADRIRRWYGRDAEVLYPPIPLPELCPESRSDGGYFLVVSRLVAYKRVDLAIQGARAAGARLVVVGDGPDRARLESLAGPETTFAGRLSDEAVDRLFRHATAVIFPGEEDFGIVPVEAMARGVPVVAYAAGGALETVLDGRTGLFFEQPTPGAVAEALRRSATMSWDVAECRRQAEAFGMSVFATRLRALVESALGGRAR